MRVPFLGRRDGPRARPLRRPLPLLDTARVAMVGTAIVCGLAAMYLAQAYQDARKLDHANELGLAGRYRDAIAIAETIKRPPAVAGAHLVRAYSLQKQDELLAASGAFADAASFAPNRWVIRRDWAVLEADLASKAPPRWRQFRRDRAKRQMEIALRLNPLMRLPRGFVLAGGRAVPR